MPTPFDTAEDDKPRGEVLSRREAMAVFAASGALFWSDRGHAETELRSCIVRPAMTAGPFYVDEQLERSDLRTDPTTGETCAGTRLELAFNVSQLTQQGCTPLPNAMVEVWHCDALGVYSGVRGSTGDASGRKFLRGYQITNQDGKASFLTIYPGWYPGRTVHIHFKLRSLPHALRPFEFVSQLFFDDALTDTVHAQPPYAARGSQRMRNAQDGIFRNGGKELLLEAGRQGDAYLAQFDIAIALNA